MAPDGYVPVTCSIDGCGFIAIVIIGVHGVADTWNACSSEHAKQIILDIHQIFPIKRGITTTGVNHANYANR